MSRPRHVAVKNAVYFVTAVTYNREPLFSEPVLAHLVQDSIFFLRQRGDFRLFAFVIMPDHLHLLLQPADEKPLPAIMHSLKSFTSKRILSPRPGMRKVWQDGYYEHGIRTERELVEKIRYIEANPGKAGFSEETRTFSFSSASMRDQMDSWV